MVNSIGVISMNQNHRAFSLISILLQYPNPEIIEQMDEITEEANKLSDLSIRMKIMKFLDYVAITSYQNLCNDYVSTFDFSERTTLYLTYSVFKDNRERGPALVKLRQEFLQVGAKLECDELPDYLPLILEFASITDLQKSTKILALHLRSIERLALELEALNSPYSHLVNATIMLIKKLVTMKNMQQDKERGII